ncbi:MAG: UxaA family hydrolase [Bacillota bacterium]
MAVKMAWVVDEQKDNVATILSSDVKQGMVIPVTLLGEDLQIKVLADIPYGHKVAIKPIKKGETVWKYGLSIGRAMVDIEVGEHVHVQNIEPMRGRGDWAAQKKGCAC